MLSIVLHIGARKCGSSAIQGFLRQNKELLLSNRVLVPSSTFTPTQSEVSGDCVWYFQNLLKLSQADAAAVLNQRLDDFLVAFVPEELETIVLSAENLSTSPTFPGLFKAIQQRCTVRVVFYVRRQDDYLISCWQQWYLKREESFNEWMKSATGNLGNWSMVLRPWENLLGRENITVRRFLKSDLIEGDVVKDFVKASGLPDLDYCFAGREVNVSFDESIGYIAHAARDLFTDIHDNRLMEMFHGLIGVAALPSRKGSSLMTLEQRKGLLKEYADGNEELRKAYFPNACAPLFPTPTQEDVIDISTEEILQEQIAMLARVLFGIYETTRRRS